MKSKYKRLKALLEYHDWASLMSDDFRRYQVAARQSMEIHREMWMLGNTKKVKKMYENAKPDYLKKVRFIDSGSQHLQMPSEDNDWDNKFEFKIK